MALRNSNGNFLIAYFLLVALPVLGLLGVLRSGRRLIAPISVDGKWALRADPVRLATLPCEGALAFVNNTSISIVQSGKNLQVEIIGRTKFTLPGVIEGTTLKLSFRPNTAGPNVPICENDHALSLVATVDPEADPRSLVGAFSVEGCPSCTRVEIHAVRTSF